MIVNKIVENVLWTYVHYIPLNKGKTRLIETIYKVFPLGRLVNITTLFQAKMQLNLKDYVDRQIYYFGVYEKEIFDLMKYMHSFSRFDFMLDVGANIGQHSLYAAQSLDIQNVYSFEPSPITFLRLTHNIEINKFMGEITPVNRAVSDVETWVEMTKTNDLNSGMEYIQEIGNVSERDDLIKSIRLDDYFTNQPLYGYGIMKIDVEGAEGKVLRGFENHLKAHKVKVIIAELANEYLARFGDNIKSVIDIMEMYGYIPFIITRQGRLKKLDKNNIPDYFESAFLVPDILASIDYSRVNS